MFQIVIWNPHHRDASALVASQVPDDRPSYDEGSWNSLSLGSSSWLILHRLKLVLETEDGIVEDADIQLGWLHACLACVRLSFESILSRYEYILQQTRRKSWL